MSAWEKVKRWDREYPDGEVMSAAGVDAARAEDAARLRALVSDWQLVANELEASVSGDISLRQRVARQQQADTLRQCAEQLQPYCFTSAGQLPWEHGHCPVRGELTG